MSTIYLGVEWGAKYVLEGPAHNGLTNTNLVPNASFENNITGMVSGGSGITEVLLEAITGVTGITSDSYALFWSIKNTEASAKTGLLTATDIAATAGSTYSFKAGVKLGTVTAGTTVKLVIQWLTAAKAAISSSSVVIPINTLAQFPEIAGAVAPATTAFARLTIEASGVPATTGKVELSTDAWQFEKAAAPSIFFTPTLAQVANEDVTWAGTAWASAATYNQHVRAVFNDSTDVDYVGDLSPESSGLDAPEMREDSADRVEADGAIFGDFFAGKRPVVLQGTIIATSKAQRNERVGKLRAASNAKTGDATLWWEDGAAGKLFVNLRRQQPLRVTKGYTKEFQLSMVSADSRILGYGINSKEALGITTASVLEKLPGTVAASHFTLVPEPVNNMKAADGAFATVEESVVVRVWGTNWGFTLPAAAVIQSMSIGAKGKVNKEKTLRLSNVYWSSHMANGDDAINEAVIHVEYLHTPIETHMFGTTNGIIEPVSVTTKLPSAAVINSSAFGVAYDFGNSPTKQLLSIDALLLGVTYTLGPEVTVENHGSVNAPTVLTINGPAKNPRILNEQTGEEFTYSGKVELGKKLRIDTESFTVVEEGTGIVGAINRYNQVGVGADWIQVKPGSNVLKLSTEEGSVATTLRVEYRDAWE